MAKNKVEVDVKIDDKGTIKKVGLEAKKAASSIDDVGNSSRSTDRNIKGVAATSSSATKNFSKMAQGAGGLVGAYATFAATMFAVSAAFQFFKEAGDFANLQKGQRLYANATGIAMKGLSNTIVQATGAQLGFKEAAQAGAIGIASGLQPSQLKDLASAAKNLSGVLGRDLNDSFNRLIRGVTKAEPELLDELGIILRLDTATENYRIKMGGLTRELTAAERTQAVHNETMRQYERILGGVTSKQDEFINSATALGAALKKDVLEPIMGLAAAVSTPIFTVLAENAMLLAGVVGIFASKIFSTIAGTTKDNLKLKYSAIAHTRAINESARREFDKTTEAKKKANRDLANDVKGKQSILTGLAGEESPARKGTHMAKLQAGEELSGKQRLAMIKNMEGDKLTIYNNMDEARKKTFVSHLKQLDLAHKQTTTKMQFGWRTVRNFGVSSMRGIQSAILGVGALGATVTTGLAAGFAALTSAFGWIAAAVTAVMLLVEGLKFIDNYFFDGATQKALGLVPTEFAKSMDQATESTKEYNKETRETIKNIGEHQASATKLANMLGSFDSSGLSNYGSDKTSERHLEFEKQSTKNNRMLNAQLIDRANLLGDIANHEILAAKTTKANATAQGEYLNVVTAQLRAVVSIQESLKTGNKEFSKIIKDQGIGSKYQQQIDATTASIAAYNKQVKENKTVFDQAAIDSFEEAEDNLERLVALKKQELEIQERIEKLKFQQRLSEIGLTGSSLTYVQNYNKLKFAQQALNDLKAVDEKKTQQAMKDQQVTQDGLNTAARDNIAARQQIIKRAENELTVLRLVTAESQKQAEIKRRLVQGDLTKQLSVLEDVTGLEAGSAKVALDNSLRGVSFMKGKLELQSLINQKEKESQEEYKGASVEESIAAGKRVAIAKDELTLLTDKMTLMNTMNKIDTATRKAKEEERKQQQRLNIANSKVSLIAENIARGRSASAKEDIKNQAALMILRNRAADQAETVRKTELKGDSNLLALEQQKLDKINQQITAQKDLMDQSTQYVELIRSATTSQLTSNLAGLIKGDKTSLTKAVTDMTKGILDTLADRLAKDMTDAFLTLIGFDDPIVKSHKIGANAVSEAIIKAFEEGTKKINADMGGTSAVAGATAVAVTDEVLTKGNGNSLVGPPESLDSKGLAGLFSDFTAGMKDVFNPDAPGGFVKKLGEVFVDVGLNLKDIFGGLFSGLKSLLMNGGGSGGFFSSAMSIGSSFLGFRNGGMSPKMGYADGGIARGPKSGYTATLHGNEAIVPLPNSKSIPVEFTGGNKSNTSNNITINIATDGSTTTKQQDGGPDMQNLGKAVAKAVQQELHNQRRSGGILNPYGAT